MHGKITQPPRRKPRNSLHVLKERAKRFKKMQAIEGFRGKMRFPDRTNTPIKPTYFRAGLPYFAPCMGGQDPRTIYHCVYVGKNIVVFVFLYQGIERTHSCYISSTCVGDYITVTETRLQHFHLKENEL